MSDARDIRPREPDRFERLGYRGRNERKPLKELDLRAQLMLEYMLIGTRHQSLADRLGIETNTPMTQQQASDAVGFRRRNGRFVFSQAVFQKALAKGLEDLRSSARVKALNKVIELVHEAGEGTAADRKVQLQAATALLGDETSRAPAGVQVNVGVNLSPGLVIRLPAGVAPPPLELAQSGETLEHAPAQIERGDAMAQRWPHTKGESNG